MDIEILRANHPDYTVLTQVVRDSRVFRGYPEAWLNSWSDQLRITLMEVGYVRI